MSYGAITRATVAHDYHDQAMDALKQFKEISLANGSRGVRQGRIMTGSNIGRMAMIQQFDDMAQIDTTLEALNGSAIAKQTRESGKFKLYGRGIVKNLLNFGSHGAAESKYIVLTIGTADDPAVDTISKFADVLTSNGAVSGRYGTFVLGDRADGKTHLFGSSYPSLGAVQSAYDAAADSGIAAELYKLVSVEKRQVIRLFD